MLKLQTFPRSIAIFITLIGVTLQILWIYMQQIFLFPLEKLFLTDRNLSIALDQLDEESMPGQLKHEDPQLQVTEMNEDHITVEIGGKIDDAASSPKSPFQDSEDIEVVYEQQLPRLKGIMKQRSRTMSESSDDVLCYSYNSALNGSESPISESEENEPSTPGRKKSVSFSEYIDRTTYKANQSVSTMHASLKNRRRRHRKREEKREEKQRRRRRSSGSECGHSSDDYSSHQSEQDDHTSDEKKTPSLTKQAGASFQRTDSNSSTDSIKVDPNPGHQPPETSIKNKRRNRNRKNKYAQNNQAKAIHLKERHESSSSVSEDHLKPEEEEKKKFQEEYNITKPYDDVEEDESCDNTLPCESDDHHGDDEDNGVSHDEVVESSSETLDHRTLSDDEFDDGEEEKKNPNPSAGDGVHNGDINGDTKDQCQQESMLSWKDTGANQEHKTQCSFSFTNSVVYDLDLD